MITTDQNNNKNKNNNDSDNAQQQDGKETEVEQQQQRPENGLLSPHSMAAAAVMGAIQETQQKQQQQLLQDKQDQDQDTNNNDNNSNKSKKSQRSRKHKQDNHEDLHCQLEEIWNDGNDDSSSTNTTNKEQAIQETFRLIGDVMTELMQDGLVAFHGWEQTKRQVQTLKEEGDSKDRELGRLRTSEQKSRESITNLLRAVETSKVQARDQSEATLHQARMRADLLHATTQKDQAVGDGHETKRRLTLISEDLRHTKSKLSKMTNDKIQLERDQRATLALAKSLQGNAHSDVDYYKRKVTELNTHIQGMSAILTEKNRQMEEMRRQMERNMSQNRLATIRAESASAALLPKSSSSSSSRNHRSSLS